MESTIDGPESISADQMQDESSSKRPQISGELDLRTKV
jgi:hypothetical protein